jgi:hypothetical protein
MTEIQKTEQNEMFENEFRKNTGYNSCTDREHRKPEPRHRLGRIISGRLKK